MSVFGLLGVLFIALKLLHVIAWSWWLVLAPIYVPLVIFLVFFGGLLTFVGWVANIED